MSIVRASLLSAGCAVLLLFGCGSPTQGPPASQDEPAIADQTGAVEPAPVAEPTPTPEPLPPLPPVPAETPAEPNPEPEPESEQEPERPPVAALPAVVDPGGAVEVTPTKEGLTRIGVDKCKICHKLQHASWAETAHAKRDPPLDCEGCHGPGSEYKGMAVMKDPAASRAAGLVDPSAEFCATCHRSGWNDGMMELSHAHKQD